jgi:hypothetical protein
MRVVVRSKRVSGALVFLLLGFQTKKPTNPTLPAPLPPAIPTVTTEELGILKESQREKTVSRGESTISRGSLSQDSVSLFQDRLLKSNETVLTR